MIWENQKLSKSRTSEKMYDKMMKARIESNIFSFSK